MNIRHPLRPRLRAALVLVSLVVGVNVVAAVAALMAGRGIRGAAAEDLQIRTVAQARAVEARLASLRGDLAFLSRSPPVVTYAAERGDEDPLVHRWRRLDAEATFLLFLEAHPEVELLVLRAPNGSYLVTAARRGGSPTLSLPGEVPPAGEAAFAGCWPLDPNTDGGAVLEARVDRGVLLGQALPDHGAELALVEAVSELPEAAGGLTATAEVAALDWSPPFSWWLVRREPAGRLLGSVEELAWWFRATAALNLGLVVLTVAVGAVALRNVRDVARLEAERQERERTRDLERQLFHSERLASVGRLAAGIAHEINNPLEGISNYLSILRKDIAGERPREALAAAERIADGVARIAGVVRQTLDLADPGSETRTTVDLGKAIDRALDLVSPRARQRGIDLRVELPEGSLDLPGDPVTIGQVLLNLVLNAVQAQPEGGEVLVEAVNHESTFEVRVSDRGPGFPRDRDPEELFEPFVSTRGTTGLGLAVARRIVEGHGGAIRAEDRPGGGSTVRFDLPLRSEERAGPAAPEISEEAS